MSPRWLMPVSLAAASAVFYALLSLAARPAEASLVLAKPGGDVHARESRVAFSTSDKRTVAFEQLIFDEARGELAWVVALPKGGWIEGADDHLFESLDEATAPVIAPGKWLGCAPTARESTAEPRSTLAPRPVSRVHAPMAAGAAADKLTSLGFIVDDSARASLAALDAAGEDVAVFVLPSGASNQTRVVRVLGPRGRPFPSILVPSSGAAARLRAWVMAPSRVRFFGIPAGEVDASKLAWTGGRSNFDALLDEAIAKSTPGVVVTFAGVDGVFVDQSSGSPVSQVPSWARQYFGAWEGGYPSAFTCASRVAGLAGSAKIVAQTCAKTPPWFTTEPLPACVVPGSEEIAASELTCGALDDLAVATGGHAPSRSWLTRFEGVAVSSAKGFLVEPVGLGSIPSFHEANVGSDCSTGSSSPPPTSTPPDDGQSGFGPSGTGSTGGGGGGYTGSSSSDGCGTTLQIMSDGCSGSSSSSSSDGCSGDSSSSGDSCDGGSSSSSGDSCGGSSSSADDGCSSSSGSSGGSCSGAASSADDGCRVTRARPRLRFSAWIYALCAVATVCRRMGRKRL